MNRYGADAKAAARRLALFGRGRTALRSAVEFFIDHPFALPATVTFVYFLYGLQFVGPAYLSDEVGYLTKAAMVAGHTLDYSTSWYGGYSILISPAYAITNDAFIAFRIVLAVNALFWGFSAILLLQIAERWFPERSPAARLGATALTLAYPSWIAISGYAFASSAFILVFLLALRLLHSSTRGMVLLAFPVGGYVAWVHPLGVPVALVLAAATLVIFAVGPARNAGATVGRLRDLTLGFSGVAVTIGMIVLYERVVHPILAPAGGHYRGTPTGEASSRLARLLDLDLVAMISVLGRLNYLFVASLGVAALGLMHLVRISVGAARGWWSAGELSASDVAQGAVLLSFAAILLVTGLSLGSRIDTPIYGRYLEMVLPALLLSGLLTRYSRRAMLSASGIVLLSGWSLQQTHAGSSNNQVNVLAYWPQAVTPQGSYLVWSLIGASAIVVVALTKYGLPVGMVAAAALAVPFASQFHQGILAEYSAPPSLINAVYATTEAGECVGFHVPGAESRFRERRNLFTTYLYAYSLQRLSYEEWYETCGGPLLHLSPDRFRGNGDVTTVALHPSSGIYLSMRNGDNNVERAIDALSSDVVSAREVGESCLVSGCYSRDDFRGYPNSIVGGLDGQSLRTNGESGYLVFGPYATFGQGFFRAEFNIDIRDGRAGRVDVYSSGLGVVASRELDEDSGGSVLELEFGLPKRVSDLEFRVWVGDQTDLTLKSVNAFPIEERSILIDAFLRQTGMRVGSVVEGDPERHEPGFLAFGPYLDLPVGEFQVRPQIRGLPVDRGDATRFEITSRGGTVVLGTIDFAEANVLDVPFSVTEEDSDIEFRLYWGGLSRVAFSGVTLKQVR